MPSFDFSIALQAGGKSTRMGTDKGLAPFLHTTMAGYILEKVNGWTDDLFLISNRPEAYQRFNLPVFPDIIPDWGALGGLHTAMFHARHEWCLLLACDMPFINTELIRFMVRLRRGRDAIVPRLGEGGFTEPFRALYRKTCLEPIADAIRAGLHKANAFYPGLSIRYVEADEVRRFDPDLLSFFNANTPAELAEARRIAAAIPWG